MQARKPVDWERVEAEYRAGILSLREIAARHGVSHTLIRRHATHGKWTRDLTPKVRQAVSTAMVSRAEFPKPPEVSTPAPLETLQDAVAAIAQEMVETNRLHQRSAGAGRSIVSALMDQLSEAMSHRDAIERTIEEETKACEDVNASAAARQAAWVERGRMLRAVSLPQHCASMLSLAGALQKLVNVERQAYRMDDAPPADGDERDAWLDGLPRPIDGEYSRTAG